MNHIRFSAHTKADLQPAGQNEDDFPRGEVGGSYFLTGYILSLGKSLCFVMKDHEVMKEKMVFKQ